MKRGIVEKSAGAWTPTALRDNRSMTTNEPNGLETYGMDELTFKCARCRCERLTFERYSTNFGDGDDYVCESCAGGSPSVEVEDMSNEPAGCSATPLTAEIQREIA